MYWFDNFPKIFRFRSWIWFKKSGEYLYFPRNDTVTIPQTIHHASSGYIYIVVKKMYENPTSTDLRSSVYTHTFRSNSRYYKRYRRELNYIWITSQIQYRGSVIIVQPPTVVGIVNLQIGVWYCLRYEMSGNNKSSWHLTSWHTMVSVCKSYVKYFWDDKGETKSDHIALGHHSHDVSVHVYVSLYVP